MIGQMIGTKHIKRGSLRTALAASAAFGLLHVAGTPARADVLVLDSKVPALKRGAILKDSDQIDLPLGASVVIVLPAGGTRTLTGPLKVSVRELSKGEAIDQSLWNMVGEVVGGGGGSLGGTGATRSVGRPPVENMAFSWRQVPVEAEGDFCVEKGAALQLARAGNSRVARVTVVDVQSSQRAEVRFDDGKAIAAWPSQVPPKIGAFAFLIPDRPMRQVRLRLIDPLPDTDQTLRLLYSQRCQAQAEAWLRGVTAK